MARLVSLSNSDKAEAVSCHEGNVMGKEKLGIVS